MKSKSSEQPKDKYPWLTKWVFSSLRSGWARSRKAPKVRKSTSDKTGMGEFFKIQFQIYFSIPTLSIRLFCLTVYILKSSS